MGSRQLCHDCAWACAVAIVECLESCLRPEERKEALHAVYERVKAVIECYRHMTEREAIRLCRKPSKN